MTQREYSFDLGTSARCSNIFNLVNNKEVIFDNVLLSARMYDNKTPTNIYDDHSRTYNNRMYCT